MSVTPLPHWMTVPSAAQAAQVSSWTLRKEIAAGRLRSRRIGRLVRILDSDLAAWMRGDGNHPGNGNGAAGLDHTATA